MPPIDNGLLDCILYLFQDRDAAEASGGKGGPGASGFVVGVPSSLRGMVYTVAVTNAHVVGSCPVIRMSGDDGRVVELTATDWLRSPELGEFEDLAIAPLGLVVEEPNGATTYVPVSTFVAPYDFERANESSAGPQPVVFPWSFGEDVFMLGRFLGRDDLGINAPTLRMGTLANIKPNSVSHPYLPAGQESFLVECRSLTGYSGSPVFIYRARAGLGGGNPPVDKFGTPFGPRLLGVDWGNLTRKGTQSYSVDWDSSAPEATSSAPAGSGMMLVVPAWKLTTVLESEKIRSAQQIAEAGHPQGRTEHINAAGETSDQS